MKVRSNAFRKNERQGKLGEEIEEIFQEDTYTIKILSRLKYQD